MEIRIKVIKDCSLYNKEKRKIHDCRAGEQFLISKYVRNKKMCAVTSSSKAGLIYLTDIELSLEIEQKLEDLKKLCDEEKK